MKLRHAAQALVPSGRVYVVSYFDPRTGPDMPVKHVHYRDPSAAHEKATALQQRGFRVLGIFLANVE